MIPFSLISGPFDPGFDSVVVGGNITGSDYVVYFSFTITSKTTTNVGIKVPVSRIGSNNIGTPSDLGVADRSVVGDTPNITSGAGFPGGLYHPTTNPNGFNRNNWVTSSDANFFYVYTSNATQKNNLTVGATYWFGFKVGSGATQYLVTANTKTRYTSTGPTINFISGNQLGSNNRFMIVDVLDYNA